MRINTVWNSFDKEICKLVKAWNHFCCLLFLNYFINLSLELHFNSLRLPNIFDWITIWNELKIYKEYKKLFHNFSFLNRIYNKLRHNLRAFKRFQRFNSHSFEAFFSFYAWRKLLMLSSKILFWHFKTLLKLQV